MNDKKFPTAQELLRSQEQNEPAQRDAETRKHNELREKIRLEHQKIIEERVAEVKRTWRDRVLKAARHEGVRFLVLADLVIAGDEPPPCVEELRSEVAGDGYRIEVTSRKPREKNRQPHPINVDPGYGHLVTMDGQTGFREVITPELSLGGGIPHWLLLRWDNV